MLRTTQKAEQTTTLAFTAAEMELTATMGTLANPQLHSRRINKALRTVAILQTTLDLEPLLRLFSREVSHVVNHCGIAYCHEDMALNTGIGRQAKQRCEFRMLVDKQGIGCICFMRGKPFTEQECAQLEFLLSCLVYPLRNVLKYQAAHQASMTDPLTGKYNRLVLESALRHEIGLYSRYETPLSMLVVDIDNFKKINDQYGHSSGDLVIQRVARAISQCLRETDILARYGGDEFTILLSNTRIQGAEKLAEYIRQAIESLSLHSDGRPISVSVSIGIASLNRDDTDNSLFLRADKALYHAKKQGRNCIARAGYRLNS